MFSNPTVLAQPFANIFTALVCLVLFAVVGHLLTARRFDDGDALKRLALNLVFGMIFTIGIGITLYFGRAGIHLMPPLVLLGFAFWARRKFAAAAPNHATAEQRRGIWLVVLLTFAGCCAYQLWRADWTGEGDLIRLDHSDYGYFAMLSKGIGEAKVSTGWAATTGLHAVAAGRSQDLWYHWGPMWMGLLISKVTGMPSIEAVLVTTGIITTLIVLLLVTAIVRTLTGWSPLRSLAIAVLSLMAMPYPEAMRAFAPFGHVEHSRESFFFFISYYYEAVMVFAILLSWLRGRQALAAALIVCATISSPHFVGGAGIAVGVLMCAGVLLRDRSLYKPAAAAVGLILVTMILVQAGLGATTSVSNGEEGITLKHAATAFMHGGLSTLVGIGVCVLFLPGWLRLVRNRSEDAISQRARLLGWLAFSGVTGGMVATYLFQNVEQLHFTDFPNTLLAMPIGFWGLARLSTASVAWQRWIAIVAMVLCTAFGVTTLNRQQKDMAKTPWTPAQLNEIKQALAGEPFGYFSAKDRAWWLPKQSFVAALLDTRCIRLWPLKSADFENRFSRAAMDFLPMEMVPFREGEPIHEWSLKFMHHVGIRHILRAGDGPIPPEIAAQCYIVCGSDNLTLYRLKNSPAQSSTTVPR
ncbi:MAG: hypothetical protein IPK32_17610 [Verrucomicrobiaceae bacterium]|nr:hypothetical protein [Verrucomicrobiaceae bacterium]